MAMLTGCVACQKVPVTETLPVIVVLAKLMTQGEVDCVTATVPVMVVEASVGGFATMAAAIAAAVGGVNRVMVAEGSETARTLAVMAPAKAASETFSAPPGVTVARYVALVGSAMTMVSLTTVWAPMTRDTASRS